MIKITYFFFSLFYLLKANAASLPDEYLIAHAGGGLEGRPYLNCLECVENSLNHNLKYIELDLIKTSDEHIVAAHDWKKFHQITNHPDEEKPLTLEEFKQRKILDVYTPLAIEDIKTLMLKNKNWILVVDKLDDYEKLSSELPFSGRIMIEVFSFENYHKAIQAGLQPIWSPRFQKGKNLLYFRLKKQNIQAISINEYYYLKNKNFLAFLRKEGIKVILFAPHLMKNPNDLSAEAGVYFDFVYSDFAQ